MPFEQEALIKRVIGLPNETLFINDGNITIYNSFHQNGKNISEYYLKPDIFTNGNQRVVLGNDEYFVLGDNRPVSLDSRYFGSIKKSQIIGRAWLRIWPIRSFQHFTPPEYSNLMEIGK